MSKRAEILLLALLAVLISLFFIIRLNIFDSTGLTNDNYALSYPLRILISTSIQNGVLPLWDHWTHGGYPLNTSLVTIAFSPIVVFLSLFSVYSTQTYAIEILTVIIIGFIGMYLWTRRYSSKLSAMIMAACFSMSAHFLMQTQLNFEAVGSVAMFPWLAYGIKKVLAGKLYGISIIALAVWIGSTEGYLGLNLIGWQFILFFCFLEWLIDNRRSFYVKDALKKLLLTTAGFILGITIFNLPLLETFYHFGLAFDKIREPGFNPYSASASLFSLFTIAFPNKINMFYTEPKFSSVTGIFYFGFFQLLFLLYAVLNKKTRGKIWLLTFFAILSFFSSLSAKYVPAVILNSIIPFLNKIRWHVWYLSITIFFLTPIASIGLQSFVADRHTGKKWLATLLFVLFGVVSVMKLSGVIAVSPLAYVTYPQTYFFVIFLILLILQPYYRGIIYGVLGLLLIEILITSADILLLGNNLFFRGLNNASIETRERAKLQTKSFPSLPNERNNEELHVNPQYYTKIPNMYGYSPVIYPQISELMKNENYQVLMGQIIYPVDVQSLPFDSADTQVSEVKITPNSVSARINVLSDSQKFVWSSPYVRFWRLLVDGAPRESYESTFGLTAFTLSKGLHNVSFTYKPPYLAASLISSVAALIISFALFFVPSKKRLQRYRNKSHHTVK